MHIIRAKQQGFLNEFNIVIDGVNNKADGEKAQRVLSGLKLPDDRECAIDLTDFARELQRYISSNDKGDLTNASHAEKEIDGMLQKLPSGSGLDNGVSFNWQKSTPNKLVFYFMYHHMKDGYYNGWTKHTLTVTPCFVFGFKMTISGSNKNDVKDYLYELFGETFWY